MCGSENGKEGHYILYSISGLLRIRLGGIAAVFLTAGALFTQQVQQLAAALGAQAGVAAQQAALEEVGAATVMPLGAPIGTNKGLRTRDFLQIIIEQSNVPVIVDAGIGAPSHAAEAMELGADAVLVNTAIAVAGNPVEMAIAFKQAVEAGRRAYEAGLGAQYHFAQASSPLTSFLD